MSHLGMAAQYLIRCAGCAGWFPSSRSDAATGGAACRQRRRRRRAGEPGGAAHDRSGLPCRSFERERVLIGGAEQQTFEQWTQAKSDAARRSFRRRIGMVSW